MSSSAIPFSGRRKPHEISGRGQRWAIVRYIYGLAVVFLVAAAASIGAITALDRQFERAKGRTDIYNLGTILRTNRINMEIARMQNEALAERLASSSVQLQDRGQKEPSITGRGLSSHLEVIGVNLDALVELQEEFGDPLFAETTRRAKALFDRVQEGVTWSLSSDLAEFDGIESDLTALQITVSPLEKFHGDAHKREGAALAEKRRENTRKFLLGLLILSVFAAAAILQTLRLVRNAVDSQLRIGDALRESEVRLRGVMDNVGDAIITTNEHGVIESKNAATEHLFGYGADELLGQNVSMLMPKPDCENHDSYLERYRDGGVPTVLGGEALERLGRRKDGTVFPIEVVISETIIGGERAFVGTVRDVNDRKRMEGLNTRLGRILDASDDEIYVFDAETFKFVQVNQGAQHNMGYSMDELRGLTPWDIKPAVSKEEFLSMVRPLQAGELNILKFETIHRRKAGSIYPVAVRLQLYESETPPVLVAMIHDITERKRVEEEMNRLNTELEQRVARRTRELEKSSDQLKLNVVLLQQTQDQLVQSE